MYRQTVELQEEAKLPVNSRVDKANGIIRGVKLLGMSSRNGRTYSREAIRNAKQLYEGAKVNLNHPKGSATQPRDYQDRIGHIENVRFSESTGELFGDFFYNKNHPIAPQLEYDAEHAPHRLGFSHNSMGKSAQRNGKTIIEAITRVVSVDLVADPATTSSLFESVGHTSTRKPIRESYRPALTSHEVSRLVRESTGQGTTEVVERVWIKSDQVNGQRISRVTLLSSTGANGRKYSPEALAASVGYFKDLQITGDGGSPGVIRDPRMSGSDAVVADIELSADEADAAAVEDLLFLAKENGSGSGLWVKLGVQMRAIGISGTVQRVFRVEVEFKPEQLQKAEAIRARMEGYRYKANKLERDRQTELKESTKRGASGFAAPGGRMFGN